MRIAATLALLVLIAAGADAIGRSAFLGDFRAFYCAGWVARSGGNPYMEQPLHRCELATMAPSMARAWRDITVPAPLPPYVIAFFIPFALLTYAQAAAAMTFLSLCAIVAGGIALFRLTGLSPIVLVCSIGLALFGTSILLRQVVPIAFAALCLAALFARRGQWAAAAASACVCLITPQVGVPVCLALALWVPQTRTYLTFGVVVLIALSIAALGYGANLQYVMNVLPAHALSEIASDEQYSLSVIVQAFGIPYTIALAVGTLSYVLAAAVGVLLARSAAVQLSNNALVVAVPAAFAVVGGSFVHLTQIALAIPLALILTDRARAPANYAFAALILLAIPWPMAQSIVLPAFAAVIAFGLTRGLRERQLKLSLAVAAVVLAAAFSLHDLYVMYAWHGPLAAHTVAVDPHLAQARWAKLILGSYSHGDALSWIKRLPTWIGLSILIFGSCLLCGRNSSLHAMAQAA